MSPFVTTSVARVSLYAAAALLFASAGGVAWTQAAHADVIPPTTMRIDIFGTGPAAEPEAVAKVRETVAKAFNDGLIESVVTLGYGIEGGFSLCLKRSRWTEDGALFEVESNIKEIPHNPARTALTVSMADACFDR